MEKKLVIYNPIINQYYTDKIGQEWTRDIELAKFFTQEELDIWIKEKAKELSNSSRRLIIQVIEVLTIESPLYDISRNN
jgi:hypothetical protein